MQKQEQNTKTMSPDSNEALCIRIQQGDEQAKSQLLQQNEGMIHAVAWRERRRYAYLALELEDLWAAGQLGMLRAARLFRPETGNQFATYAWPHVRQAIQREIISGGTIIRIPVHLHDRMHKLSVYREPNGSVNYEALAERVTAEERTGHGMTASEVKEFLCRVEPMVSLRSLNEMLKLDGETERQEMLAEPDARTPDEEVENHLFLEQCLEQLKSAGTGSDLHAVRLAEQREYDTAGGGAEAAYHQRNGFASWNSGQWQKMRDWLSA